MGGKKLKTPLFAVLFLGVWILVQIPSISAQEIAEEEISSEEVQANVRDPRADEINMIIDAGGAENTGVINDTRNDGSSTWVVVRMLLVLALAAAAVYGVVFFIKRSSKQPVESNPFLKILASAHLGQNRFAHIVAVGNKAWLLGSSDGGVSLIGEVDDKDVINAMLLEDSRKSSEVSSNRLPDFLSMLRRLGAPAEARSSGADDIRKRRERLKGL